MVSFFLHDSSFVRQGLIEQFKTLIWTERYSKPGDITITSDKVIPYLKRGMYVSSTDSDRIMRLDELSIDKGVYKYTGKSLENILDWRLVWNYREVNGNLQAFLKLIAENSFVNDIDPKRNIPGFSFKSSTDTKVTSLNVVGNYKTETILKVFEDLCTAAGIGFKLTKPTPSTFCLELYAGRDLTKLMFSPDMDNFYDSSYLESDTKMRTLALVGGQGQGAAQTLSVYNRSPNASGLDRREVWVAASTSNDNDTDANRVAAGKLALENTWKNQMVIDGALMLKSMDYGADYYLGDRLFVNDGYGHKGVLRVTEFIMAYSETERKEYPTLVNEEN